MSGEFGILVVSLSISLLFIPEFLLLLLEIQIVINDLFHSRHIWDRVDVLGSDKLLDFVELLPLGMSTEEGVVNDEESAGPARACRAVDEDSGVFILIEQLFHVLRGLKQVSTVFLQIEAVIDRAGYSVGDSSIFEQSHHVVFVDGSLLMLELGLEVEHCSDPVLHEELDVLLLCWSRTDVEICLLANLHLLHIKVFSKVAAGSVDHTIDDPAQVLVVEVLALLETELSGVGLRTHDANTSEWFWLPENDIRLISALLTVSELKHLVRALNKSFFNLMMVIVDQLDGAVPRSDSATILHWHPILVHRLFLEVMLGVHWGSGLILLQDDLVGTRLFGIQDTKLHGVSFPFICKRTSFDSSSGAMVVSTLLWCKDLEVRDSVDASLPANNLGPILDDSVFIRKIESAGHERLLGDPPISLGPSHVAFDLLPVPELRAITQDGQSLTSFKLPLDFELALVGRVLYGRWYLWLSSIISGVIHFYLD